MVNHHQLHPFNCMLVKQSHKCHIHGGGQHTDTDESTPRKVLQCRKWELGTWVHIHVLPWTAESNSKTREKNYSFSTLCHLKGIFIKTIHRRLKSANPLQLVIIKLYPKLYTFLESCCIYSYLTSFTCPHSSLHSPPLLPTDPLGRLPANPKAFLSLCYPGATRPPLPVIRHWDALKPYLIVLRIIKL